MEIESFAWLLDRLRWVRALASPSLCPACETRIDIPGLCAPCRADSGMRGEWRSRRIGDQRASPFPVYALGLYRGPDGHTPSPAATALLKFKYAHDRVAGRALAGILARADEFPVAARYVVVPIPLHARRLRERGFNQAAWLARALARRHRRRLEPDALECRVEKPSRPGLSRLARSSTSANRFDIRRSLAEGTSVVLVDDVCTTGLTLDAARRALEAAGARVRAAAVLLSTERATEVEDAVYRIR